MRDATIIALCSAGYAILAHLSMVYTDGVSVLSADFWPVTGISLAILIIASSKRFRWLWAHIPIGALLAARWSGVSWPVALGFSVENTLSVLVAFFLYRRFVGQARAISDHRSILRFTFFCVIPSALVSALACWGSLQLGAERPLFDFSDFVVTWAMGRVLWDLVFTPFVLLLATFDRRGPWCSWIRAGEFTAWAFATVLASALGFTSALTFVPSWIAQPSAVLALLLGWALRFEMIGATSGSVLASLVAVIGVYLGHPASFESARGSTSMNIELYLLVITFANLILASIISERASAQRKERNARSEAERALRAREDFMMIAAHELRTPLTPIQLQLQALQRVILKGVTADTKIQGDLLKLSQGSTRQLSRVARLVEDILDFSEIIKGELALELKAAELSELTQEALGNFLQAEENARVVIELNVNERVHGNWDRFRIEQVVATLLTNATKYGEQKPIEVTVSKKGAFAVLSVRDHGIGIAEADQARIFERFERAVPVQHFSGFGLGLFISRKIVQAHGGTIRVESQLGAGSVFTVELPI